MINMDCMITAALEGAPARWRPPRWRIAGQIVGQDVAGPAQRSIGAPCSSFSTP
ncbi:MAG: hypothetical protein ACXV3S_13060 [Kineosporiaceae bacterium]